MLPRDQMDIIGGTVRPEPNSTGAAEWIQGLTQTFRPNIWRANVFGFLEEMQVNLFIYVYKSKTLKYIFSGFIFFCNAVIKKIILTIAICIGYGYK